MGALLAFFSCHSSDAGLSPVVKSDAAIGHIPYISLVLAWTKVIL